MLDKETKAQIKHHIKEFRNFLRAVNEQVYGNNTPSLIHNIRIELAKLYKDINNK